MPEKNPTHTPPGRKHAQTRQGHESAKGQRRQQFSSSTTSEALTKWRHDCDRESGRSREHTHTTPRKAEKPPHPGKAGEKSTRRHEVQRRKLGGTDRGTGVNYFSHFHGTRMPRGMPRSVQAAAGLKCNLGPPLYFKKGEGQGEAPKRKKVVPGRAETDAGGTGPARPPDKRGGGTPRSQARTPKA